MSSRWQRAWDEAEVQIEAWRNMQISSSLQKRVLRVGQLDAELLDEELVQILQEPLTKAFGIVNSALRSKLEPELALIIRLTLYKFSMWDLGATYGAKLQDLRYHYSKSPAGKLAPSGLPKRILASHALLTVLIPYLHNKLRGHALSNAWPDTPTTDKRRKAWNIITQLESLHSAAALLGFVVFLWNGRYRTLADRLLSLQLIPSCRFTNRQVSYEFMNRQMVWHAFTEFLLLFLPVFSSRAFRRTYNQLSSRFRNLTWSSILPSSSATLSQDPSQKPVDRGRFFSLSDDQCAICAERVSFGLSSLTSVGTSTEANPFGAYLQSAASLPSSSSAEGNADHNVDGPPTHPITTPYRASCGHIYCYACLSEKLLRAVDDGEDGWSCLRCTELVRSCERVDAILHDDSSRTSDGWEADEDIASFESDMDTSLDSEHDYRF
ncbi:uncharacterized protein FOMMEDRAFT_111183 [Fomitiporia mediterranea MF3/22]|uniref:uncharacterized protein n=1 Tax=Fomitiporia mediterranea (strain MF3/22) TaxID=694068 RepID=UPI0004408577|nr:uncharacterized protein FOMMEDRAFT_111183 [Fomitiporia mediterranea MF3/22]EJD01396.1 hypothetical protein FOMMEDRAFT_111183 [Fomitiporia mediterranea MF3/22]